MSDHRDPFLSDRENLADRLGIPNGTVEDIKSPPHFCRDGHAPIRFWHSDEDDRCPLCRTLDHAVCEEDKHSGR